MITNWIHLHANDTLAQLFLARMIILAAAIAMGVAVFGLGAVIVRCVDAARLRLARRRRGHAGAIRRGRAPHHAVPAGISRIAAAAIVPVRVARARSHLSDFYAPWPRHQSKPYPGPSIFGPSH